MAGQQTGNVDLRGDPVSTRSLEDLITGAGAPPSIDDEIDAAIATRTAARDRKAARDVRNVAGQAATGIPYTGDLFGAAQSALRGMAQGAAATRIGFNELIGDKAKAEELRGDRKAIDEFGDNLSPIDTGANIAGRLAYEAGEYAAPGAILGKAAKLAKLGKVAKLLNPTSKVGKVAVTSALAAPLNVTKAADRDNSTAGAIADLTDNATLKNIASTRTGRGLFEVATDVLGNTVAEGVHGAWRARKLARIRAERAAAQAERAAHRRRRRRRRRSRRRVPRVSPAMRPAP